MSKIDKTSFDIHRTSSCASTPYIRLNIVDVKTTRQGVRPGFTDIDELPYAHFSAQYDTTTDNYECRESDAARMIPSSEAKACHNLLLEACDKVKSRVCPCYSFADLMKLEKSIENSFINVDSSKTCLDPTVCTSLKAMSQPLLLISKTTYAWMKIKVALSLWNKALIVEILWMTFVEK